MWKVIEFFAYDDSQKMVASMNGKMLNHRRQVDAKVVITAEVEDTAKWEQGFRSHGDLFRSQTITTPISMAIREGNQVAICAEPADLGTFMEILESPVTAEAMGHDGVRRDTVKVYLMDREFQS